uniref:TIGR02710 family CRISPR-associated protein n=1 Tax=Geobacter metallireducens TaxID=28232 RepID=A0A831UE25_GEOME
MTGKKVLLVSVGGSPAPVVYTINQHRPEYVIFFASRDSREKAVAEVLPNLDYRPRDHQFIVTPNEQDLEACARALLQELPKTLDVWRLGFDDLGADYTGGTKTMSAAVVLALSRRVESFSYVGGIERDKAGLGVVIDGREQMLYCRNPWDTMAVDTLREMALLFNRCRFQSVMDRAREAARRADARRPFFEAMAFVSEGFYCWDAFEYRNGMKQLKRGESMLRDLTAMVGDSPAKRFHGDVAECLSVLGKVVEELDALSVPMGGGEARPAIDGRRLLADLVANAVRRADVEHRYEDAVARLYSAIEKMAKVRLRVAHDIDNSRVAPDRIPDPVKRGDWVRRCAEEGAGSALKLPLFKSFELLHDLGDPLGKAFRCREEELKKILDVRNKSLVAHGFEPVRSKTYEKMLAIALDFLGAGKDALPRFPLMDSDWFFS